MCIITSSIARSEGDFEIFILQGQHVAPMGVKFDMEEWTKGPLLCAKFHPKWCNNKHIGAQKLKILLKF